MINNHETSIEKIDKKEGLWQFIKFTLVSLITTVVELTTFTLFNYLIFSSLSLISFKL